MTTEQINTLGLLNGLIAACGSSHYGFTSAAAELRDPVLKPMFIALGEQRAGFMRELHGLGDRWGGVDDTAAEMEVLSKKWKPLREAVAASDLLQVLDLVIQAENSAAGAYRRALDEEAVAPEVRNVVRRQLDAIEKAREQLQRLRSERAGSPMC